MGWLRAAGACAPAALVRWVHQAKGAHAEPGTDDEELESEKDEERCHGSREHWQPQDEEGCESDEPDSDTSSLRGPDRDPEFRCRCDRSCHGQCPFLPPVFEEEREVWHKPWDEGGSDGESGEGFQSGAEGEVDEELAARCWCKGCLARWDRRTETRCVDCRGWDKWWAEKGEGTGGSEWCHCDSPC